MYKIVIIDDDENCSNQLKNCLARFFDESEIEAETNVYDKPLAFLQEYKSDADVIFADIKMPGIDGLELAQRVRAVDKEVAIIFTTSYARYAIDGYAVQASGYLLKPLDYEQLRSTLKRLLRDVDLRTQKTLTVRDERGVRRIAVREVKYIEVLGRTLTVHLVGGDAVQTKGTLKGLEEELTPFGFFRCSHSYFVNLRYVGEVGGNDIVIDGKHIPISRGTKKEFMAALVNQVGRF